MPLVGEVMGDCNNTLTLNRDDQASHVTIFYNDKQVTGFQVET